MQTFGDNSGPLFDSVKNLSQLTDTLAANDRIVDGFMGDLTSVSTQLAEDRGNLRRALAALARAVGIVRSFVHDNKDLVEKDVEQLTDVVGVLAKQKDSLNTVARLGALGLGNLALAYDEKSGTIGSRLRCGPDRGQPRQRALRRRRELRTSPNADVHLRAAEADHRAVHRRGRQQPAEPRQQPQLKLGGTAPVKTLGGPARLAAGGQPVMRTSSLLRRRRQLVLVIVASVLPAGASSTAPTTCRSRATRSSADDGYRSPPTSPTPSTWCRAPR